VSRVGKHAFYFPLFYRLTGVHDDDSVRDLRYDSEVVADEHAGELLFCHAPSQHLQDPALNGNVKVCGGFVCNEYPRSIRKRHGDAYALFQAPTKLEGIAL